MTKHHNRLHFLSAFVESNLQNKILLEVIEWEFPSSREQKIELFVAKWNCRKVDRKIQARKYGHMEEEAVSSDRPERKKRSKTRRGVRRPKKVRKAEDLESSAWLRILEAANEMYKVMFREISVEQGLGIYRDATSRRDGESKAGWKRRLFDFCLQESIENDADDQYENFVLGEQERHYEQTGQPIYFDSLPGEDFFEVARARLESIEASFEEYGYDWSD